MHNDFNQGALGANPGKEPAASTTPNPASDPAPIPANPASDPAPIPANPASDPAPIPAITLCDGRVLPCFALDTTGEYLAAGGRSPRWGKGVPASVSGRFFYEHAFFFLDHAEQILADSRMFLAPVPVQNGMAYTGTSGFLNPTLGVYIEYWLSTPAATVGTEDAPQLIWFISGSPLSGAHACSSVDRKGRTRRATLHSRFLEVASPFARINSAYTEAKGQYSAFTLEEVYERLKMV